MKNWKDKVLGIFAGIGVMSLLMGNYAQQPKGVWEMHTTEAATFTLNTETGEIRKMNSNNPYVTKDGVSNIRFHIMKESNKSKDPTN